MSPPQRERTALVVLLGLLGAGCRQDMHSQPRFEPFQPSDFFPDGRSSRPLVEGTVPRGFLRDDEAFYLGKASGKLVESIPLEMSRAALQRGRERYDIYCSPCHDRTGSGNGIVVQRGFRRPESFHTDRLLSQPAGYFFDIISNGFGAMYDYRESVVPADRWAIVAHVRVLQLSQHATLADVSAGERAQLEEGR